MEKPAKLGTEFNKILNEHLMIMAKDGFVMQGLICVTYIDEFMLFIGQPGGVARERFLKLLATADADFYAHQMLKD